MTNTEMADTLRRLAAVYENAETEIGKLYHLGGTSSELIFCHDKKDFAATCKAFGAGKKSDEVDTVVLNPTAFHTIQIHGFKNGICERVVIGTREVPEMIDPARVIPAHTEEVVQWRCSSFLQGDEEVNRG